MEVVRSYDIARLVLGYLRDNKLDKAAKSFCKSSPYLTEEYELLRKGFWPVSLRHDHLPDIVREYCEIQSEGITRITQNNQLSKKRFSVVQFIESLPEGEKERFPKHGTLLSKVHLLIKAAKASLTEKVDGGSGVKRRLTGSEEKSASIEATQEKDLPGYFPPLSKRRRVSSSFMCLANNRSKHIDVSSDEESLMLRSPKSCTTDPDYNTSNPMSTSKQRICELHTNQTTNTAVTEEKMPTDVPIPGFPAISEALLENVEFQHKLVENINKALSSAPSPAIEKCDMQQNNSSSAKHSSDIVTQFEEMIKSILDETEKDPTFNELIEDIVLSNNPVEEMPLMSNQSTQCSPPSASYLPDPVPVSKPQGESTIKERLRPRKPCTSNAVVPKDDVSGGPFFTPYKTVAGDVDLKNDRDAADSSMSLSKLILLNPNETLATSTPLISDSLLASSGSQLLHQLADNIFIDVSTGQTIPFIMTNSMNTIFLDTTGNSIYGDNLQLGKIIDSKNLETIDITPQEIARLPVTVSTKSFEQPQVAVTNHNTSSSLKSAPVVTVTVTSNPVLSTTIGGPTCPADIIQEKKTPSISTVSMEMARSLSTPRRRSSHIRVLNFKTPLKTRSETKARQIQPSANTSRIVPGNNLPSRPGMAESRDANYALNMSENIKTGGTVAVVNESSNSSSNNDFAKTSTNATVIYQSISETPKRKSEGRKSCARVLSRSGSEENEKQQDLRNQKSQMKTLPKKKAAAKKSRKAEKSIKKSNVAPIEKINTPSKTVPEAADNSMEAWARLMSIARGNWDQHIRQACANEEATNPAPPTVRKKRRKAKITSKQNQSSQEHSSIDHDSDTNMQENETQSCPMKTSSKKALIEFKIATPIKVGKSPGKLKSKVLAKQHQSPKTECKSCEKSAPNEPEKIDALLELRTNNIGVLLDTPYKVDAGGIPPTPGFLIPDTITTPLIRVQSTARGQISLCKNPDLPTPNYAITPGACLTPFEKDTPRSGYMSNYPTDYSSGSSYYKPDESEELDKNFESIMAENRRKAKERNYMYSAKPTLDTQEAREVSQEESSNQTVITAINKCTEVSAKLSSTSKPKATSPQQQLEDIRTDDHSRSSSTSESGSSKNSSDSCSCSSNSDSNLNANNSDEDVENTLKENNEVDNPETLTARGDDNDGHSPKKDNEADRLERSVDLTSEVRYPIRHWAAAKRVELQSSLKVGTEDKKLSDVVDKIKSRPVAKPMKTKQIETLQEKCIRIKGELKEEFAAMDNKRPCYGALKRPNARIRRAPVRAPIRAPVRAPVRAQLRAPVRAPVHSPVRVKKAPIVIQQKQELQKTRRAKIEVLSALNLSEKSCVKSAMQLVRSPGSDIFDGNEDSKDSAETLEVRKAAYALTNLSKGSGKSRRIEELKVDTKKEDTVKPRATAARRGRAKKTTANKRESQVKKVYPPHKPVTRGTSKQNQRLPEKLDRSTSSVAVTFEVSKNAESVAVTAIPTSAAKMPDAAIALGSKDKNAESSSDQEEDIDQYDACEMSTVDEKDPLRYFYMVYDQSNPDQQAHDPVNVYRHENLSSAIMNIFINGAPHQIVIAEETELFRNTPLSDIPKPVTKMEEKPLVAPTKKKPKATGSRKVKIEEIKPEAVPTKERAGRPRIQPKINIKYKQRTTVKGKSKTEPVRCENLKKSPTNVHFCSPEQEEQIVVGENSHLDAISAETMAAEAQGSIKTEDIFAVLSLIHGE